MLSILVVTLNYSLARCYHWGKPGNGYIASFYIIFYFLWTHKHLSITKFNLIKPLTKKERKSLGGVRLCNPMDYSPWDSPGQNTGVGLTVPFSRGSSQPRYWTQASHIAGGFFTSWATRKAQELGEPSLALLQRIFPTQESNQGLLHCRWIL